MKGLIVAVFVALLLTPVLAVAQSNELYDPSEVYQSNPQGTAPPFSPTAVLWDNGPLSTCSGCGAGGADESMLQSTSLGMNVLGFAHQASAGFRIADDFTVAGAMGWDVDQITFFAYQTGSSTMSPITAVNLQIWDGLPGGGGTVIWGDTTTNLLTTTTWSNIYRTSETSIGATNRPIMANTLTLAAPLHLDAGTYWLDWQTDGSLASGPWAPPVTILGTCVTGDGLQSIGGVWAAVQDSGSGCAQDFPFVIEGAAPVPTMSPAVMLMLSVVLLLVGYYFLAYRRRHA